MTRLSLSLLLLNLLSSFRIEESENYGLKKSAHNEVILNSQAFQSKYFYRPTVCIEWSGFCVQTLTNVDVA